MSATVMPVRAVRCFRVEIAEVLIGVFARCEGLQVDYEVIEYVEGGENGFVHKLRGGIRYANLVLSRGITSETGLLDWMLEVQDHDDRPTVTISLLDQMAETVRSWGFSSAFPVRWKGPTMAEEGSVATEVLEIAHNGLVRP